MGVRCCPTIQVRESYEERSHHSSAPQRWADQHEDDVTAQNVWTQDSVCKVSRLLKRASVLSKVIIVASHEMLVLKTLHMNLRGMVGLYGATYHRLGAEAAQGRSSRYGCPVRYRFAYWPLRTIRTLLFDTQTVPISSNLLRAPLYDRRFDSFDPGRACDAWLEHIALETKARVEATHLSNFETTATQKMPTIPCKCLPTHARQRTANRRSGMVR
ncbi:hypothetical protein AG1IA_05325 [Rhizoctonia solani AG-1 IA]|uniref:Uncharacterized protein n=1 Tax=Thanatephorus cucumeris (strain AG1-IA) TaxID=983506 RepID=L8WRN3_THACA|nr:hypothetical protein AG1IA_05325 [Rhizoctonia solani AG-1 IA]